MLRAVTARVAAVLRERSAPRRARMALIRQLPSIDRPLTLACLVLTILQAAAAVGLVVSIGSAVGSIPDALVAGPGSPAQRQLVWWVIAVGVAFVAQHALVPALDYCANTLGRKIDGALRARLLAALMRPPGVSHLEDERTLNQVREALGVGEGQHRPGAAAAGLFRNFGTWLTVISQAVIVALFSVWLAVILLAFLVVVRLKLVNGIVAGATRGTGATAELRRADYFREMALRPEAAKEIRIFGLGGWVTARYGESWWNAMGTVWNERARGTIPSWRWSLPWGVLVAGSFVLVAGSAIRGDISLASMTITLQAIIASTSVWFSQDDIKVAHGATSVPALLELERATAELADQAGGHDPEVAVTTGEIRFEQVSFRYPGQTTNAIQDLDMVVPAGRSLAIVGENGAGKTTLVKLLARMYDPTGGRILVDGTDLRCLDTRGWQRQVAAIFQDFTRFELSVADNVGFGRLERAFDRELLKRAAEVVSVRELIESLDSGWDTRLTREFAEGTDLSGGQWQKIALARAVFAVLGGARILILDEPTASLDVRAESELFDRLTDRLPEVTTILISHRFSTVRRADHICVMDGGRIVEQGSHAELMARQGRYARMFMLQAVRFADAAVEES